MSDTPRTFIVEVTVEKRFRVVIGGPKGSARIEGEADEDAAEAIVTDYGNLGEAQMPPYIALEDADQIIETVREIQEAAALAE